MSDSFPIIRAPRRARPVFVLALLAAICSTAPAGENVLPNVPDYRWFYGCSPTSGGMMIAYWDSKQDHHYYFGNLYSGYGDSGDAQVWWGTAHPDSPEDDPPQGPARMIASQAHIVAGHENGLRYGSYMGCPSYPLHSCRPDCIADFMKTRDGGTGPTSIGPGLEGYCRWDDPGTQPNESYQAVSERIYVPCWGGSFDYARFKQEIDADRPVLLSVRNGAYHSVVGYGYRDDMFQVKVKLEDGTAVDITAGGFAVRDTWWPGTYGASWKDWEGNTIKPVIEDGVEWWPFADHRGGCWDDAADYMVTAGNTLVVFGWRYGDANHDGVVNGADYSAWAQHYQMTGAQWEDADFTCDGTVDGDDYTLWADNYGYGVASGNAAPGPSALGLLLAGAAACAGRRRR